MSLGSHNIRYPLYWIFRATQNYNRWCIINEMFAKSLPLDTRVNKISQGGAFPLSLAGALAWVHQSPDELTYHHARSRGRRLSAFPCSCSWSLPERPSPVSTLMLYGSHQTQCSGNTDCLFQMMFGPTKLLSSCFWLDNKLIFGPTNDDWLDIYSQFIKFILMEFFDSWELCYKEGLFKSLHV